MALILPEAFDEQVPCPECGGVAKIVAAFDNVDYVQCACGYCGDRWEDDDGVVHNTRVSLGEALEETPEEWEL